MWPPWAFMHSFSLSTTMANDVQSVPHSAAEFVSCMFERRQFWAVQSSQTCAHHGHFNICQTMGPRFVILKNSFRYLSLVIVLLIITAVVFPPFYILAHINPPPYMYLYTITYGVKRE